MKIKSRLENLTDHINDWVKRTGKQHVAASIVEVIETSHYKNILASEGITFVRSRDIFKDRTGKRTKNISLVGVL